MFNYMECKKLTNGKQSSLMLRYQMVQYAMAHGISACAREYRTTRKTVRNWLRRFMEGGDLESLRNKSRVGQNHPLKTSAETIERIIKYRKKTKNKLGARRIVENLNLTCSAKTVHKIIRQNGLMDKPPTKWQRRKDMSLVRAQYRPFEKIQLDAKYLNDIPECYPAYARGDMPKYLLTARDYKTGWLFMAYSNYLDDKATSIFALYLLQHLKAAGIDLNRVTLQTDNGREFVNRLHYSTTLFQQTAGSGNHIASIGV